MLRHLRNYFTPSELTLWFGSVGLILISFLLFNQSGYLTLIASLIGVTSLIYNAKGNSVGPLLMIVFSILYGIISWTFRYYGEMLTYVGMTMPMAVLAFISWLKNPYQGNKAQVQVNRLDRKEYVFLTLLSVAVTLVFYYILRAFNTAYLLPSTISVTTSFLAVYLTYRRSPHYALAYAANDIVLIVLWVLAARENLSYLSVVVCFGVFLVNDIYGFLNWKQMGERQAQNI